MRRDIVQAAPLCMSALGEAAITPLRFFVLDLSPNSGGVIQERIAAFSRLLFRVRRLFSRSFGAPRGRSCRLLGACSVLSARVSERQPRAGQQGLIPHSLVLSFQSPSQCRRVRVAWPLLTALVGVTGRGRGRGHGARGAAAEARVETKGRPA